MNMRTNENKVNPDITKKMPSPSGSSRTFQLPQPQQLPRVPDFFAGRYVLVTGATGFMGKVLLEKLMRSCPKVAGIYLLLRPKRGKQIQERVNDILDSELFSLLKKEHPGLAERVLIAVAGDVSERGLGLSPGDRAVLQDKVSVVFHGAATVRFDEPIRSAVLINVRGTREMADLAMGMKNLDVFLHISTTYCNTDRKEIDEKVYPPHADWRKTIAAIEALENHELDIITPKLLGGLPNTYTFTKSLGEHCIYEHRDRIPLVVFRPSIVISSMSEPVPGWMDNFHGPVALMVAAGKGLVHIALADTSIVADYMPVDIAIKAAIVAAWKRGATATRVAPAPETETTAIYNCSSSSVKPVAMADMIAMARPLGAECPFDDVLWPPYALITNSRTHLLLGTLLLHMVPALVLDTVLWLQGKRRRLWRLQRRIYAAQDSLAPFLLNSWKFRNAKALALDTDILPEDREDFSFDFRDVDEYEYFRAVTLGARRYLLNERDEDLPKAKAHYDRMVLADQVARATLLCGLLFCAFWSKLYMWPINVLSFLLTL